MEGKKLMQTKLPEKKLFKLKGTKKIYLYRRRVNLQGIKTSNDKARLRLLNVERTECVVQ